jgi:hypothetical protein
MSRHSTLGRFPSGSDGLFLGTTSRIRCEVLKESELFGTSSISGGNSAQSGGVLAATGNTLNGLASLTLIMLLCGTAIVSASVKLERKSKAN